MLLAAEVVMRVTLTGLPIAPAWFAVVYLMAYYIGDALGFFGLVRLAQIVGDVQQARRQPVRHLRRDAGLPAIADPLAGSDRQRRVAGGLGRRAGPAGLLDLQGRRVAGRSGRYG